MPDVKLLAFYLPQFHPIPENDEWWGKGFTEWTSVAKAKPLFRGHRQPKIPADLGFYDLRLPEIREEQARLARSCGIQGFCYWHYWFGHGRRLLERPFEEILKTGKPGFPFCLGWANESWQAKIWGEPRSGKILIEQRYGGVPDYQAHFESLIPAFKDPRYISHDGRPLFYVYRPKQLPDIGEFLDCWRACADRAGLPHLYLVAQATSLEEREELVRLGFDAVCFSQAMLMNQMYTQRPQVERAIRKTYRTFAKMPLVLKYSRAVKSFARPENNLETVIPSILPNWDHSPRSGRFATVLVDGSPDLFRRHVEDVLASMGSKQNGLIFLKSWNEWGEGNYMEPDQEWGHGYMEALATALARVRG